MNLTLATRTLTSVFALALSVSPALAQTDPAFAPNKSTRSIAITATESITTEADVASVHIGYLLYGPDKDAAYANGSRASNAIVNVLYTAGVQKDAIESDSQSINATEPDQNEKRSSADKAARAFQIQQSWNVRVRAEDASRVLDLAVKAGANQSGAIDWKLRDPNAAQTAAAAKALQRARSQAAAMAEGLNVKLGSLLYASNQVEAEPTRPVMRAMKYKAATVEVVQPLAINPRQIETSATVYAVFAVD